jgi:hypothetical protein
MPVQLIPRPTQNGRTELFRADAFSKGFWHYIPFFNADEELMTDPSISDIVKALAPAFVAGFAVQQAVEVVSSVAAFAPKFDDNVKIKKATLSVVAVAFAACIVAALDLDVLKVFNATEVCPSPVWHGIITTIFSSAGTEGFNSLLKWLSYKKEDAKASAADKKKAVTGQIDAKALQNMPS